PENGAAAEALLVRGPRAESAEGARWPTRGSGVGRASIGFGVVAALDGKTAIVTGASSGIGAATARALVEAGARVAVGSRRVEKLPDRDGFYAFDLDVTDRESSERFVERAVSDLGGVDVLVNNAGLGLGRDPFWESNDEDEQVVIDTDVRGLMRMTRLCLPHIRDGGHI